MSLCNTAADRLLTCLSTYLPCGTRGLRLLAGIRKYPAVSRKPAFSCLAGVIATVTFSNINRYRWPFAIDTFASDTLSTFIEASLLQLWTSNSTLAFPALRADDYTLPIVVALQR